MNIRYIVALLFVGILNIAPTHATEHIHGAASIQQAEEINKTDKAPPRLTLFAPRADVLQDGYVYLPFRVDNMTILPLYTEIHGAAATKLTPMIGHLHVMVDGNGWNWIHALNDPIYFGPLKPGAHQVRLELVDAAHAVIEVQTVNLVVP
jgi:hypothetical protein